MLLWFAFGVNLLGSVWNLNSKSIRKGKKKIIKNDFFLIFFYVCFTMTNIKSNQI